MSRLQLTIPTRQDNRPGVRIKAREVRVWLENLPYMDLPRASRSASEQLRLMNRQMITPAVRLEILGDFLRSYHRLLDSLPTNAAETATVQPLLKRLCQDAGFGYKIVVHELVNDRAGFMETRHLSLALLGALHTLGLQLMHYYVNYQRAPRSLWSECLALFRYAQNAGRSEYRAKLPGAGELQITDTFKLIALIRLTDPYSLSTDMVNVLRGYFGSRIDLCGFDDDRDEHQTGTGFLLTDAHHPPDSDHENLLRLNLDRLTERMAEDLKKLTSCRQPQAIGAPREVPLITLQHTFNQVISRWQTPLNRKTHREQAHTRIQLVIGLGAAYCAVNNGRCYDPGLFLNAQQDEEIDLGVRPVADNGLVREMPEPFDCSCVNRSSGGLAISYRGPRQPTPQIGQLISIRRPGSHTRTAWVVGVCRWLTGAESGSGFNLGVQYLAREPRAVVIRVRSGHGSGSGYQPAVAAAQKRGGERVHTLIAGIGQVQVHDLLELHEAGGKQRGRCTELLESGPGFERFIYQPL